MKPGDNVKDQVSTVERRLESRRQRIVSHVHEMPAALQRATTWIPPAIVGVALVAGFALARRDTRPAAVTIRSRMQHKPGFAAALLSAAAAALRLAMSPQGRWLWSTLRASRDAHSGYDASARREPRYNNP